MEKSPDFELFPYPNRDGKTWGWRWHNTANNRDFGPTFPTMKKAGVWLNENSVSAVEATSDVEFIEEAEDAEAAAEDRELVYVAESEFSAEDFQEDEKE